MLVGVILKESLEDLKVLDLVRVTRTETWQVRNAAPYQPPVWTALSFEADESQADELAQTMAGALKPQGWFINASTEADVYVIFPGRVFRYRKGDREQRQAAVEFGRSLAIPESQLDWSE